MYGLFFRVFSFLQAFPAKGDFYSQVERSVRKGVLLIKLAHTGLLEFSYHMTFVKTTFREVAVLLSSRKIILLGSLERFNLPGPGTDISSG
jgi:hypothetical protein